MPTAFETLAQETGAQPRDLTIYPLGHTTIVSTTFTAAHSGPLTYVAEPVPRTATWDTVDFDLARAIAREFVSHLEPYGPMFGTPFMLYKENGDTPSLRIYRVDGTGILQSYTRIAGGECSIERNTGTEMSWTDTESIMNDPKNGSSSGTLGRGTGQSVVA